MSKQGKYALVNIDGQESVVVRITKTTPLKTEDRTKLTDWADKNGFTISNKRRLIVAE